MCNRMLTNRSTKNIDKKVVFTSGERFAVSIRSHNMLTPKGWLQAASPDIELATKLNFLPFPLIPTRLNRGMGNCVGWLANGEWAWLVANPFARSRESSIQLLCLSCHQLSLLEFSSLSANTKKHFRNFNRLILISELTRAHSLLTN